MSSCCCRVNLALSSFSAFLAAFILSPLILDTCLFICLKLQGWVPWHLQPSRPDRRSKWYIPLSASYPWTPDPNKSGSPCSAGCWPHRWAANPPQRFCNADSKGEPYKDLSKYIWSLMCPLVGIQIYQTSFRFPKGTRLWLVCRLHPPFSSNTCLFEGTRFGDTWRNPKKRPILGSA